MHGNRVSSKWKTDKCGSSNNQLGSFPTIISPSVSPEGPSLLLFRRNLLRENDCRRQYRDVETRTLIYDVKSLGFFLRNLAGYSHGTLHYVFCFTGKLPPPPIAFVKHWRQYTRRVLVISHVPCEPVFWSSAFWSHLLERISWQHLPSTNLSSSQVDCNHVIDVWRGWLERAYRSFYNTILCALQGTTRLLEEVLFPKCLHQGIDGWTNPVLLIYKFGNKMKTRHCLDT